MTRFVCLLAAVVALVGSASALAPIHAAESYEAMVARLKAGDTKVDYGALRIAYAESIDYSPYAGDFDGARTAMATAYRAKDCKATLENAAKVLDTMYIDILSHALSSFCYKTSGDRTKAEFHSTVGVELVGALLATGDGKSAKTAFVVVTMNEEYDVLSLKSLTVKSGSRIKEDGHAYELKEVKTESGEAMTVFFQIDRLNQWTEKILNPQ